MIALILVMLPASAERTGDSTRAVIRHLLFATGIQFLLLASHHVALVLVTVWLMQQCPTLILGLTAENGAHVASIPLILSRVLTLVSTALATLTSRAIGV